MSEDNNNELALPIIEGIIADHDDDQILVRVFAARVIGGEQWVDNHVHYYERRLPYGVHDGELPTLVGGDRVGWGDVKGREYTGMFGSTQKVDTEDSERWQALLIVPMTGRGDYTQSATWMRANMNVLLDEYPDTFITIGYSSHDGQSLALPMDAVISDDLADRIESLWGDSYCLDDDENSKVEQEILEEDWDSWLGRDFHNELEKAVAEVRNLDKYEVDLEEYVDELLKSRETELKSVFWEAMEATNTYPEFETSESCYIRDIEDVAKSAALTLTSTKELEA